MTQNDNAREAIELAERIRPMLAGRAPQVQSGVIAELMATYLAGWRGTNVKPMRQELFDHFEWLVWLLVAVSDEHAAGKHDNPPRPADG